MSVDDLEAFIIRTVDRLTEVFFLAFEPGSNAIQMTSRAKASAQASSDRWLRSCEVVDRLSLYLFQRSDV